MLSNHKQKCFVNHVKQLKRSKADFTVGNTYIFYKYFGRHDLSSSGSSLRFLCKTLKKEGLAFRNIGNIIFPTVKSALLLIFCLTLSCTFFPRCFARLVLQLGTSRNFVVKRFMEVMSIVFLFTIFFHCRSFFHLGGH